MGLGTNQLFSASHPVHPTQGRTAPDALAQALADLRQQHLALRSELDRAQAELAHLRTELSGTQADERMARHQSRHDGLTGLPNRRLFMEAMHHAMDPQTPNRTITQVMYLDIDGFKAINDQYGHQVGDAVLQTVGARLAKSVRIGDVVARLGGDEFACLVEGALSQPQLMALAHQLQQSIAAPMKLGTLTLHIQVSIGLACAPNTSMTKETLLAHADAAMYHAKRHREQVALAPDGPAPTDPAGLSGTTGRG